MTMYEAFEWDHKMGSPLIRWVVMRCSGLGERMGEIQGLPPRADIAYFIDEATAEQDAKAFAKMKNEEAKKNEESQNLVGAQS